MNTVSCTVHFFVKKIHGTSEDNFEESHLRCVYRITKYQIYIDIQSEHNYVILLGVIHTTYQLHVSATLLGHHQVCI